MRSVRGISLFSGIAGLDLGLKRAIPDLRVVAYVEQDADCQRVLRARIADGLLDDAPIFDDVRTFEWGARADLVFGGFPCQDVSNAGKRAGIDGERSGLWSEFARIVGMVRPRYVFVENVGAILVRGGVRVVGDLAALGYDSDWALVRAADVGAPQRRERFFLLGHSDERDSKRPGLDARTGEALGEKARQPLRECGAYSLADAESERERKQDYQTSAIAWGNARADSGSRGCLCGIRMADADAQGDGRGERGTEPTRQQGRPDAAERSRRMADPLGAGLEERTGKRRDTGGGGQTVERDCGAALADADLRGCGRGGRPAWPPGPEDADAWKAILDERPDLAPAIESPVRGVASGIPDWLDRANSDRRARLKALGNAVVPAQAELAWRILYERLEAPSAK